MSENSNDNLFCSQGLYHSDQRFGPGVISYPDGRKDVGLWVAGRLLKLCATVEPGFTLKSLPEYVTYMDPATTTDSLTKVRCHSQAWLAYFIT